MTPARPYVTEVRTAPLEGFAEAAAAWEPLALGRAGDAAPAAEVGATAGLLPLATALPALVPAVVPAAGGEDPVAGGAAAPEEEPLFAQLPEGLD